jgi:hypothetical protein
LENIGIVDLLGKVCANEKVNPYGVVTLHAEGTTRRYSKNGKILPLDIVDIH